MFPHRRCIIILLLTSFQLVLSKDNIEEIVNRYETWINRRNQEVQKFEFPEDARMYEAEDKTVREFGEFDFIIVGAGSTGCVVANRLSENPHWNVLLLEAGTFRNENLTRVPRWGSMNVFSEFNWGFQSVPQENSLLGIVDRRARISRGKGVGGSSLINGIAYSRGDRRDYDTWAELLNDPSWNYTNVLPYFKKSENFTRTNPFVPIDEGYHGYKGPLAVTQDSAPQNITNIILRGGQELGYNITDYNGAEQQGFSVAQYFMKDGRRFEPDYAFIFPALRRRNLKVVDSSYVTKVVFHNNSNEVKGVIFTRNSKTFLARCSKEVILSAGAISSPQILMLSGIGPQDHLRSLGIPVIQNLPVGYNLLDHSMFFLIFSSNITTGSSESLSESIRDFIKGQGYLTRLGDIDVLGLFTTTVSKIEKYPDIEILFGNFSASNSATKYYSYTNETVEALQPKNAQNAISLQFFNLNQLSVGTLRLNSSDPFEYPLIDPNLLSDKYNNDIETLYQGIQIVLKLIETDAFRSLNVSLAVDSFPSCESFEPLSREYWYCYIRMTSTTGQHPVGTCSAGRNRTTGVVDKNLRVFGTKGLRVADASVIPLSLRAHINAPCTMIGEKVSDIIKMFYNVKI